jgi:tRNA G18 (ribose-2'-O)-methylase SpoU
MFRTADAAGVTKIYLTGYTPTPLDRFRRKRKDVTKTALGAEDFVPWEYVRSPQTLLKRLRREGFSIVALEQSSRAVDYKKLKVAFPAAVLLGNEVRGLSPGLLRACDAVAEIPMHGRKESLNVAVAAGIFLFCMLGE